MATYNACYEMHNVSVASGPAPGVAL